MSLVLYTLRGCYPCDRAKTQLINSKLKFTCICMDDPPGITMFPTLCILNDKEEEVARLLGPHNINKENVDEILKKHNITLD